MVWLGFVLQGCSVTQPKLDVPNLELKFVDKRCIHIVDDDKYGECVAGQIEDLLYDREVLTRVADKCLRQ